MARNVKYVLHMMMHKVPTKTQILNGDAMVTGKNILTYEEHRSHSAVFNPHCFLLYYTDFICTLDF